MGTTADGGWTNDHLVHPQAPASVPGYGQGMGSSGEDRSEPSIEHAASSEAWLRHTLEEILSQVRVLLDIDGCAFQTVDHEHQHISLSASWFERLELRTVMQPVLDRPYDPERGGVTEAAVERGEPILINDVGSWKGAGALRARLALTLDDVQADAAWGWYRMSSFISCPVRTAGGRTLGVLALSSSPPRPPLNEEHLRVTEVFAGLAALALERSELLEREARRSRDEQLLHGAAQRMTASLDLDAVYGLIVEQAALVAAAPTALLLRIDDVTQTLRAVAEVGATDRISRHHYTVGEGMIGRVAQTGEAYLSRFEDRGRFLPWVAEEGVGSFVHVPIDLGPRRFGVLTVSHPEQDALGEPTLELLQSLSRPAAAAIANALEFQHERRIAGALTRGFIPDAPSELHDFELGLVYEPVGHEISGGDIFGVWRLRGGALAVLVGDVCGKGLEVAAVSAMVRFFVEARTWDSDRPAAVLQQTNEILRERLPGPVALVTAFLAVVDDAACATRTPGMSRRSSSAPTASPASCRRPGCRSGWRATRRFEQRELAFGPDDLLFASTDGLTEARRGGEQLGQARVSALVAEHAAAGLSPQALVELAYARALQWAPQLDDDVALIALRPRSRPR